MVAHPLLVIVRMSNYKIMITPVIDRKDGITSFDKEFSVDNVFVVSEVKGELELCALCDSIFYWSSSSETKTITTSRGNTYETRDHWWALPKGSRVILEKGTQGNRNFKFKRNTRFNKIVEFSAVIVESS